MSEIFFDIETGGFSSHRSSILSLSWAKPGGLSEDYFASPTSNAWISRWAEGQIWEKVKKQKLGTEQELLEKFLGVLEAAPEGTTLAGWNIGYNLQAQDIEGKSKGFDVPFILGRAEAYGLRDRYSAAIGKMHIRDIGQEYAIRLSSEISQYPELVEAGLFESAGGYTRHTQITGSIEEQARRAVGLGRSVAGWKQELLHDVIFPDIPQEAHESRYDVQAAMRLRGHGGPIFRGPEDVQRYNRQALVNKLISSSKKGGEKNKLENLIQLARSPISATGQALPSVEQDFLAKLRETAVQGGIDWQRIEAGEGFGRETGRLWSNVGKVRLPSARLSSFTQGALKFAKQHKVALGIGIGAAAVWAAEPVSFFSGRDDSYNTINGLPHGGMAQRMRTSMTDFGSGYQGDKEYERAVRKRFGFFEKALDKYGKEVGTGHKRILIPKKALGKEQIEDVLGFVPVAIAIPEAGQKTWESYRHPSMLYHIHDLGESWSMHEDVHPASTMLVKKWFMERAGELRGAGKAIAEKGTSLLEPVKHFIAGLPHVLEEGVPGAYYYLKGRLLGGMTMLERLQRDLPEDYQKAVQRLGEIKDESVLGLKGLRKRINRGINQFSGKDDAHNTIRGLPHGGMAQKKRRELTDFGSGYQGMVQRFQDVYRRTFNTSWAPDITIREQLSQINPEAGFAGAFKAAFENQSSYMPWTKKVNVNLGQIRRLPEMDRYFRQALEGLSEQQQFEVVLGHELGHARLGRPNKKLLGHLDNLALMGGGAGMIAGQFVGAYGIYKSFDEGDPTYALAGAGVMAAGGALRLREERVANRTLEPFLREGAGWTDEAVKKFLPKWNRLHSQHYTAGIGKGVFKPAAIIAGAGLLISALKEDPNTIEGLPHGGMAENKRHELTDFGSKVNLGKAVNRAMNLFRGTTAKIATHRGMLGKANLGPEQKIAEQVLERVREAQFPHRPSRLTSTYWAPDPKAAAKYAGAAGSGGYVSKMGAGPETFFTRQDFYTEMIKTIAGKDPNKKQILLEQAQKYWRGVDPGKLRGTKEFAQVEALIPGEVTAEKLYAVRPGRKGPKWRAVNPIEGLSSQGLSQMLNKIDTDFGSPADLLKAANRAHKLYKKHFIQAFKKAGISTKGVEWTSLVDRGSSGEVAMALMAKKEGKLLAGLSYAFEKNAIDITQIEVGKGLPAGLGKELFASEAHTEVFRKIGYEAGTKITSPVANPVVGRWQMQAYGSRITQAPGVDPKDFASLEQAVINKELSHEKFPGGVFEGALPKRPSIWERIGLLRKRGLSESGPADAQMALERTRKLQETHQRAQVEASKNALRPGQRHRQKTGAIVR